MARTVEVDTLSFANVSEAGLLSVSEPMSAVGALKPLLLTEGRQSQQYFAKAFRGMRPGWASLQ